MPKSSLFTILRGRTHGKRSRSSSSPPADRAAFVPWDDVPPEFRPVGELGVRVLPVQVAPSTTQRPLPQLSQFVRQEVQKMNKTSSVLLQLPPPRALWRRSLEDLSPTKRREWFTFEDQTKQAMSVSIACAMPPYFFDEPPVYSSDGLEDVSPMSDEEKRRAYLPAQSQFGDFEDFQREIARMPTFTPTEQSGRRFTETEFQLTAVDGEVPSRMTVDTLLLHPMLRVSRDPGPGLYTELPG